MVLKGVEHRTVTVKIDGLFEVLAALEPSGHPLDGLH
jgi:hypothetical protein